VYQSQGPNLTQPWHQLHAMFTDSFQCADFAPLPASQRRGASTHLVLTQNRYIVGSFDAKTVRFTPAECSGPQLRIGAASAAPHDHGNCGGHASHGAGQSLKPRQFGRRVLDAGHTYSGKSLVDTAKQRLLVFVSIYADNPAPADLAAPSPAWGGAVSSFPRELRLAADGHTLLQVIPTPSHLLDRISPIFPPFFPVFCAFSPSRRDGSNEPQARTQGQETAGTGAQTAGNTVSPV